MRIKTYSWTLALLALIPAAAFSKDLAKPYHPASIQADLTSFIQDQMAKNHVRGLSIALVDGSKLVWAGGFGLADVKGKVPATPDTLYMAGGLSKLLTAAEVMQLVEQKKLKLEAPIRAYLPDFSMNSRFPPSAQITLRSLLAHHSGLPCFYLKGIFAEKPMSLEELVSGLRQDSMVEPPRSLFRFSYLDYDLLGRILEVVRGGDFPLVMKKDLLDPLGMNSSDFGVTPAVEAKLARGYRHGKETPLVLMRDIPVSGMASTANDMAKFIQALFTARAADGKPWLRKKTVSSMFEPQYPGIPLDFGEKIGLGWMLSGLEVPGAEQAAWHEGSLSPYYSQMTVLYKQQLGVVLLSNTSEAQKIGKDIAVRAMKLLLRAKYGIPEKLNSPKIDTPKEIKINPLGLDAYAGLYSAFGQVTPLERHGTHFSMRLFNAGVDLVPVGNNLFMPRVRFLLFFHYDFPNFMMRFENIGGKQAAVLEGLPVPVAFEKITPVEIPKGWEEALGEYTLDNPDDAITLSRVWLENKEGILTASLNFSNKPYNVQNYHYDLAFLPVSDTEAVVPGMFLTDGGTLRAVKSGGQIKLFYSGYWFTLKKHSKE